VLASEYDVPRKMRGTASETLALPDEEAASLLSIHNQRSTIFLLSVHSRSFAVQFQERQKTARQKKLDQKQLLTLSAF
jgi:hypothetical protein